MRAVRSREERAEDGGVEHSGGRFRRRRRVPAPLEEREPIQRCWRVLASDEEILEATKRALAYESERQSVIAARTAHYERSLRALRPVASDDAPGAS